MAYSEPPTKGTTMRTTLLKRIARNAAMIATALVADSPTPTFVNYAQQESILREKRLARKEMLESEAFKKALPSVQMQMLRTLDN